MEEVLKRAEKDRVKFVDLWFTDILGVTKNISIPVEFLEKALTDGVWFDGSSIEGFGRICESDMYLMPDPSTYTLLHWDDPDTRTARLICDVYSADHRPFEGDPRYVLKRAIKEAEDMGFSYKVGPELEFFLFRRGEGKPEPEISDRVGYFDLEGDLALTIRKEMLNVLSLMGITAEASHHEVSVGQHEIDLLYGDALEIADRVVTTRVVVKKVAEKHGLYATFMPKPVFGINGSGMHVHQSLFRGEENAFSDPGDSYGLSKVAYNFLAGQLKYVKEFTAVVAPLVNSYKRLVPGYEAPVYICWGQMNRSALIRVPRISKGRGVSTRLELRNPDPSANPYLAFAVMLRAGLAGIKENLTPDQPLEEDAYHMIGEGKFDTLPGSLYEALEEMRKSQLVRKTLGDFLFEKYLAIKMKEWDNYRIQVTRWELNKYLLIY